MMRYLSISQQISKSTAAKSFFMNIRGGLCLIKMNTLTDECSNQNGH